MNDSDWESRHRVYWGSLAPAYDRLYVSPWSRFEDQQLEGWLSRFFDPPHGKVLDLACGTGLGLELARRAKATLDYVGLDISVEMLDRLRQKHAIETLCCAPMDDLSMFEDAEFDYVICLNSAFSLAGDAAKVLDGIRRVLKSEGSVFLSALNRCALRRLVRGARGKQELFATRNAQADLGTVPALTYTAGELSKALATAGFVPERVHHQGVLAGVLEHFNPTGLERWLLRTVPVLAHSINVVARRTQ